MPPPGAKVNASHVPSGDHSKPLTGSSNAVTSSGQPPAADTVQIVECRSFGGESDVLPSGEKLGEEQCRSWP